MKIVSFLFLFFISNSVFATLEKSFIYIDPHYNKADRLVIEGAHVEKIDAQISKSPSSKIHHYKGDRHVTAKNMYCEDWDSCCFEFSKKDQAPTCRSTYRPTNWIMEELLCDPTTKNKEGFSPGSTYCRFSEYGAKTVYKKLGGIIGKRTKVSNGTVDCTETKYEYLNEPNYECTFYVTADGEVLDMTQFRLR